jgi:hypothetical protein
LAAREPSKFCYAEMIFTQPASRSAHDQYSPTTRYIVPDLEEPIRAELFGVERFKPHADCLAAAPVVFSEPRLYPLLTPLTPRVLEKARVLLESCRIIARAIQQEHVICCCPPRERKQAGDGHSEDQSGQAGRHGRHHTIPQEFLHE